MPVTLRAIQPEDLPLLTGADAPFNTFGPPSMRSASPPPSQLDESGGVAIVAPDGQVAGSVGWHWRHWGPNRASWCPMLGIWLRTEYRGQGIGAAAQRQVAELFFTYTTTNRVEAHTDVENIAEQRALESAGFQREGITRGAQFRDGAYHDGFLYAVLRNDSRASTSA